MKRHLFWFRADLRVSDNLGLQQAMEAADELLAIYIITPETWVRHSMAPIKVQFILNNLRMLSKALWDLGIPLLIRTTNYFSECPRVLQEVCHQFDIHSLYFNKQYEVDEQKRDTVVRRAFENMDSQEGRSIQIYAFDDQLILPPGSVLNGQGLPYKVFTPFKKAWIAKVSEISAWRVKTRPIKKWNRSATTFPDNIPEQIPNFISSNDLSDWPAGEEAALSLLQHFIQNNIHEYATERDFPVLSATSHLSPYLAAGVISPRQCMQAVLQYYEVDRLIDILNIAGPSTWISELIWREFYKQILYHFPRVSRHKPFKAETDTIIWNYDTEHYKAWCAGNTGFPLVDAAMRQLNQTGWMHNRLRMVVANFFTKVLFLDWRLGEKYFMDHLIDGDLAANNGGWQWSASTGTDAAPYFRIFNPILQSEKFDKDGTFIRKFCPELIAFNNKAIHEPYQRAEELAKKSGYPAPIIELKQNRLTVLDAFKSLKI